MDTEMLQRFWTNLVDRPTGPMAFRFYLQPIMGLIFAVRDGIQDGRTGRTPYFWSIASGNSAARRAALREGLRATRWIFMLGIVIDVIYQWQVFKTFYPLEAVAVAAVLAFLPYLLLRGPVARIIRWWLSRHPT